MRHHPIFLLFAVMVATGCSYIPKSDAANDSKRTASITDYGAVADGTTLNTAAIQKGIDALAWHGGGTLVIPAADGKAFLSGALFLKPGRSQSSRGEELRGEEREGERGGICAAHRADLVPSPGTPYSGRGGKGVTRPGSSLPAHALQ